MKLNLGCGLDIREGYINIDLRPLPGVDIVSDISKLDMFPLGTIEEIYASHVLEHIPPNLTIGTLCHWRSLLTATGKLVIRVPDLKGCMRGFLKATNEERYGYPGLIKQIYGNTWFPQNAHLTGFTKRHLRYLLGQALFTRVEISKGISKDAPELRAIAWFRSPSE